MTERLSTAQHILEEGEPLVYMSSALKQREETQKSFLSSPSSQSPKTIQDSFRLRDDTKRNVHDKHY